MCGTTCFLHGGDFVKDVVVITRQEMSAADDHVDLIGAFTDGESRVVQLDVEWILPRWKPGRDGGHLDATALQVLLGDPNKCWINADSGDVWDVGISGVSRVVEVPRLVTHLPDLARR